MKIYIGKNKKKAKEVTLKQLICLSLEKGLKIKSDRFSDDSGSWIDIIQDRLDRKGTIDVHLSFDPKDDNTIIDVDIWTAEYILDDENAKRIV